MVWPRPSLLSLGIPIFLFLIFSIAVPFLETPDQPLHRNFKDVLWAKKKGVDLELVRIHGRYVLEHKNPYPPVGHYPFPPQSLAFAALMSAIPHDIIYRILTLIVLVGGPLLLTRLFVRGGSEGSLALIPLIATAFLVSRPVNYAMERGNLAGVCSILVFGAALALQAEAWIVLTVIIATLTILKLIYAPLILLLWLLPHWRRNVGIFLALHVIFLIVSSGLAQSWGLAPNFIHGFGSLASYVSPLYGGTNVSFPSIIAGLFTLLGHREWAPVVMSTTFSIALFAIGAGFFFFFARQSRPGKGGVNYLGFALLLYVTLLWQYFSTSYGMVMLFALIPLCDFLFLEFPTARYWLLAHAVCLGFALAPCEFPVGKFGFMTSVPLLVGFVCLIRVALIVRKPHEL